MGIYRMIRFVAGFAIALFLSLPVVAQTATLEYSEGTIEKSDSSGAWHNVDIGSTIPLGTIRLRDNGLADFRVGANALHFSKDGVYNLAALSGQIKSNDSSVVSLAAGKAAKLTGDDASAKKQASAGGVRAAEQSPAGDMVWATGDDENTAGADSLDSVRSLIAKSQYDQALAKVNKLLKDPQSDRQTAHLIKAQILSLKGLSAAALRELQKHSVPAGDAHFAQYLMLVAGLSLDVQDWDTAIAKAAAGIDLKPDYETVQTYQLIQALGLRGKGDNASAVALLNTVIATNPDNSQGKEAKILLSSH